MYFKNSALVFTFINRVIGLGSAFISMLMVTTYFSIDLQGYYYIFNNLLLLNFLLDIGFGVVLVQFISHEWAHLYFKESNTIHGDKIAMARLAGLIRISLKWYIGVALFFLLFVGIGGYFFMGLSNKPFHLYDLPWILLTISVSFSIILSPFKSLLEGTNQIAKNQLISLFATIFGAICMWAGIYFGMGLYSLSANVFGASIVTFYLMRKHAMMFLKFRQIKGIDDKYLWRNEFWGQQWKIGLSWLLGYFMMQSFVPLSFKLLSTQEAGKIGATMQLFNVVNMVGFVWISSTAPKFGILGAKQKFLQIKKMVNFTIVKSLLFSSLVFVFFIILIYIGKTMHVKQFNRFTEMPVIILILLTGVFMQFSNVFTSAVRFQKKEPFLIPTFVCTVLEITLIICTVKWLGVYAFGIVFFVVVSLILVPWTYFIYRNEFRLSNKIA